MNHSFFLMVFLILFLLGFGSVALQRTQRLRVERQFWLDECTGKITRQFSASQNKTIALNHQIKATRLIIKALLASPSPLSSALTAARIALHGLVIKQDLELTAWKALLSRWSMRLDCQSPKVETLLHPVRSAELNWKRPSRDEIGEQELTWNGPEVIYFEAKLANLSSVAGAYLETKTEQWSATFAFQ